MTAPTKPPLKTSGSDAGLKKANGRLNTYRLILRDWRFWTILTLIIGIAVVHLMIELGRFLPGIQSSDFVPSTLFLVPVAWAALRFGLDGSGAAAVLATVITIPNLVLFHHGLAMAGEILQLAILNAAAVLLGYWVDRERDARQRARAYAAHVISAQEKERQRIARDIHDESIQTLVLLCQNLDSVNRSHSLPAAEVEKLGQARATAEKAAKGLRDLTRGLRPPVLEDLGMMSAIRTLLIDLMDRTGADGQLRVTGQEQRLPPDLELGIFRIAQEALTNIEHHARAMQVIVEITFADKQVGLSISDDGAGFSVLTSSQAEAGHNLGLTVMSERAEMLGGSLRIQSVPGKGTRISAAIPLPTTG